MDDTPFKKLPSTSTCWENTRLEVTELWHPIAQGKKKMGCPGAFSETWWNTPHVEPRRWFFLYKFGSFSTGLWILWFLGRVRLQRDIQKICGTFSQHYRIALPLSLHTLRTQEILVDEPGYGIFSAASLGFALWTTAIWCVSSFGTCRHLGKLDITSLVYHAILKV